MWLASKVYIAYTIVCALVAILFGTNPFNPGLLICLFILWIFATILHSEFRNG